MKLNTSLVTRGQLAYIYFMTKYFFLSYLNVKSKLF